MAKAPTSLQRLKELADSYGGESTEAIEIVEWLHFTYNLLLERKSYHKKQQLKKKMLVKAASELLSPDEMEEIERRAQEEAEGLEVPDLKEVVDELE